jgi:molybdate/tungstate transport system substrate-binding protein
MRRRTVLAAGAVLSFTSLVGRARAAEGATVSVLYAGSLVNLMEHGIGPAFDKTGGGRFQGYAGGSDLLARQVKGKLRQGDVFISANPRVNDSLSGATNGNWVDWYVTFAQSPLVIGYNPSSRFAADLKSKPWYEVLQAPGIRIGRTDPKLDPKGRLTVAVLDKAADATKQPGLAQKVLGAPENPAQVFPEETLVGRLQSGQLDVGFFYSTETSDLKIPALTLPPSMTLSAHYTATILAGAPNPAGADRFLTFLLGAEGRQLMRAHGLGLVTPAVSGDASKVPAALRPVISAAR